MKLFYHPALWGPRYDFDTTRKPRWMYESLLMAALPGVHLSPSHSLAKNELEPLHDEVYLTAVETGEPLSLAQSQGFDWCPEIFPMALAACGSLKDAALDALENKSSATLGGGFHHAKRHRGQGCCTFQGVIAASRAAQQRQRGRVIVIDLDAHCAGGTHSYLTDDDSIWQLDLATSPVDGYKPVGNNTLDLIRDATKYLSTLARRLERLQPKKEEIILCIYKAGVDLYEGCDTGGLRGVTTAMIGARDEMVFAWCRENQVPVALLLAGGYVGPNFSREELVSLHRTSIALAAKI